jgi:hypothetical protein
MVAFVHQSLFNELLQALHVHVIYDLGEDSKSIGFVHLVISLLNVFGEATDHNEDLIFISFKFLLNLALKLAYLNKDIHQSS